MIESSYYSTFLTVFIIGGVLDFGDFNRCAVVSHCCFNSQFPNDMWCWVSFHMFLFHPYIFFGEGSIEAFCPFFNQVIFSFLSFKSSLHILYNSLRCDFCKYFLPVLMHVYGKRDVLKVLRIVTIGDRIRCNSYLPFIYFIPKVSTVSLYFLYNKNNKSNKH